MLAILQFSCKCLLICIALLQPGDELGEFTKFARFVKFPIFATCKGGSLVLLYVLPCYLRTNLANWPHLPDLSNLPIYSLPAKGALLSMLCRLPCCLLMNLVNWPHLPDLSNLPYSLPAKGALLCCYMYCLVAGHICCYLHFWTYLIKLAVMHSQS